MNYFTGTLSAAAVIAGLAGCTTAAQNTSAEPTLTLDAPAGAGCYKSDPGRDRALRARLLALQEGEATPAETVEAIKQVVESAGFPFNQVPAAESAAAYALSGGDLAAWQQAYEDYAEPGETGRTSFLNSLCWLP